MNNISKAHWQHKILGCVQKASQLLINFSAGMNTLKPLARLICPVGAQMCLGRSKIYFGLVRNYISNQSNNRKVINHTKQ